MNRLAQPLPFRQHVKIYGYTNLMRRVPAGMLFLVAGRACAYSEQDVSARASAVGSFLEFFLVVLTGLPLAALAGAGLGLIPPVAGISLAIITLALELGAVHPAVLSKLLKLAQRQSLQVELTYRDTLSWVFIYTLIWLVSGTGLFAIARLFTDLTLASLPVIIGAWVLSSLVSYLTLLSPSGLGVKELSLTLLFGLFTPDPLPLIIALAIRIVWTIYDILISVAVMAL